MGVAMQADTSASARLLQPHTPMTPTQAESQRILSNMPDPDPCHRINFEWSMKDLEAWSQAEQELKARAAAGPNYDIKRPPILPQGPLMLGGRVWWSAAARSISIAILLISVIAESLIILRNASVRITGSPEDTDLLANAGQDYEEEARRMARFALKMLKRDVAEDEASGDTDTGLRDAECTNPECQWVHNTDVQNNSAGIPLSLAYHVFTTMILSILVLAEFKIWTYRLHPSSTLNVGIIQVWAGLATLSRAVNDMFGMAAGAALIIAGFGNIVFGFLDRWTAGGPGLMFFGTGVAPAKAQLGGQPPAGETVSTPGKPTFTTYAPSESVPPDPTKELLESEKLAGYVVPTAVETTNVNPQGFAALYGAQSQADPSSVIFTSRRHGSQHLTGQAPPLGTAGLPEPPSERKTAGPDIKPILDQLAVADPAAYQSLLQEVARRHEGIWQRDASIIEEKPARVHFSASPGQQSSSSRRGKKWQSRMTHTF